MHAHEPPTFTVVVPTRDRPKQLSNCLRALAELDFPREQYEVIVVDDGSVVDLSPVTSPYQRAMRLRSIRQETAGPAVARNTGAREARGRLLAFTDDDCMPHPGWLRSFEASMTEQGSLLGGPIVNELSSNPFSTASQVILDVVYQHFNRNYDKARLLASCNIAAPTDAFRAMGGFDTRFSVPGAEDRDLCDRWRHRGWQVAYIPDAVVGHSHHLDLLSFYRQHLNYGHGAYRYHQLRALRESGRMRDEIGLHFRLPILLRQPLRELDLTMKARVLSLLPVWQVANAHGYFAARWAARKRAAPIDQGANTRSPTRRA